MDVLTELDIVADWFAVTKPKKAEAIAERLELVIKYLQEKEAAQNENEEF